MAKPVLSGRRRASLIDAVSSVLSEWKFSPFEFEGPCRAGLRSAFCEGGSSWLAADIEAASIVDECLRRLGAVRPSWAQGQPEHTESRFTCLRCGSDISEEDQAKGFRYCSDECCKAEMRRSGEAGMKRSFWAHHRAWLELKHREGPAWTCEVCRKNFRRYSVHGANSNYKYCSQECKNIGTRKYGKIKFECCGKEFIKRQKNNLCCSLSCSTKMKNLRFREKNEVRICLICGDSAVITSRRQQFCSKRCGEFVGDWRRGTRVPKKIGDLLFDFMFTTPIALSRASRNPSMFLTAGLFDSLFREAA